MRTPLSVSLVMVGLLAISAAEAPDLSIRKTGPTELTLEWTGTGILERSAQLDGTWEPLPTAVSGWNTTPAAGSSFFRLRPAFPLQLLVVGQGTGTVSSTPAGLSCTSDCQTLFAQGTTVTLSAIADAGSEFAGWTGDYVGVNPCELTMDGAKTVTATFAPIQSTGGFVNGNFEQGPTVGWQQDPNPLIATAAELEVPVWAGQYAAWVGYTPAYNASATIRQTVTLPNTFPLYLNFAIWLYSEELCDVPYFDSFGVYANGFAIEENERVCQGNTGGNGWRPVSLDVSLLAGQEMEIAFHVSSVGTLATVALIDEVHFSDTPW